MNRLLAAALRTLSLAPIVAESREDAATIAACDRQLQGAIVSGDGHVLTGNADLADSCEWVPTVVTPGTTPLPDCEHFAVLASIER